MSQRTQVAIAWTCVLALHAPAGRAEEPPDRAAIAGAGRATAARVGKDAASWTAVFRLPGGSGVEVVAEVVVGPGLRRTVVSMAAQGRRAEVFRIVERDGVWYVTEGRKAGKYRPYEAPFELGTAYHFLALCQPRAIEDEDGDLGAYEATKDGVASYRSPLTEPQRQQLRQMLAAAEQLQRQAPESITPEIKRVVEDARETFERGAAVKIDLATGLIVQFGSTDRKTEIRDFRWLDRPDPEAFRVDGASWQDFTSDPTEGDRDELVMIGHAGTWRPGMKGQDTDGRLLDLATGRFRRIPFQGSSVLPGCFLKGRSRVVVPGVDPFDGSIGLYEIDLATGENLRLGGDLLASGITIGPALSPDGKTLVAAHSEPTGRFLEIRACLVDVESGEARPLGDARDQAYFSWPPDGRGLLFLWREAVDPDDVKSERTHWICRMDLEGRVEKIRKGNAPSLLDDRTILFRDDDAKAWRTCGLDGRDEKPFADGRSEYNFPAMAPDGKRILMMRFRSGAAPEPTILPIGEGAGKAVVPAPGLWTSPAWR